MHHGISITRRLFVLPALDLVAKGVTNEMPIDTYLFGEQFSEKLKAAKEVQKSAKEIAKPPTYKNKPNSSNAKNTSFKSSEKSNQNLNQNAPPSNPQANPQASYRRENGHRNSYARNEKGSRRHYSRK